ncbi:hypothetical protein BJF90_21400 [Pseudonocardia sp. CNS-004]|nr:hypothetical protein BJF90_21400 [Pseudonocardia sp. CNS-004]
MTGVARRERLGTLVTTCGVSALRALASSALRTVGSSPRSAGAPNTRAAGWAQSGHVVSRPDSAMGRWSWNSPQRGHR